jgi:hypothetical protein
MVEGRNHPSFLNGWEIGIKVVTGYFLKRAGYGAKGRET